MIIRARAVVTMDGAPISNGAIAVSGNVIVDVGEWESVRRRNSGEVVDLGEAAILPGLINAHCHLDYTCLRGKIARQDSFTDWIRAINAERAKLSADDYIRSIDDGFAEARRFGTTSIANLTGVPEVASRTHPLLRTWWFAELINIRAAQDVDEVLRALPPSAEGLGLAPHAPYTASADLYQKCAMIAEREDLLLTTHLAESKEEMAMSLERSGSLADFLRSISPDLFEARGNTPVEHLSQCCRLDERWLLVHVNEICDRDVERLGNAHIVHCPRSHAYFGHTPFEFAKLRSRGLNICLGTDSLASNDDLSLFAEMRQFHKIQPSLSGVELLEMVTINPARALRREGALGRLRAGYRADVIALPHTGGERSLIDVIAYEGDVSWIMLNGVSLENA